MIRAIMITSATASMKRWYLAMNDYHPKPKKENGKGGKFDFLIDYIDTAGCR